MLRYYLLTRLADFGRKGMAIVPRSVRYSGQLMDEVLMSFCGNHAEM